MDLDKLTLGELKQLRCLLGDTKPSTHSFRVGDKVLIRTVTFFYTGEIETITDSDLVLKDAAWIADTGRFSVALVSGVLGEVEPYPHGVTVQRSVIVDHSPWRHVLPRDAK